MVSNSPGRASNHGKESRQRIERVPFRVFRVFLVSPFLVPSVFFAVVTFFMVFCFTWDKQKRPERLFYKLSGLLGFLRLLGFFKWSLGIPGIL